MSKPTCLLVSPLFTRSGYGDWGVSIAKSLIRYGKFDLHFAPTMWGACSKKNIDSEINDPEIKEILNRILKGPLQKQPDVFIQMTIPNEFNRSGLFNIGMTAGIETTVPRAEWLEGLNRMDVNVVTSKHAKDIFVNAVYAKKLPDGTTEDLKVTKPMDVLFWGADTNTYHKTNEKVASVEEVMRLIPEEFAFLFVGQWTAGNIRADRKSIGYLMKTFLETFANINNPPCLILKTSGAQLCVMDKYECLNKINDITNMVKQSMPNAKLPNVYLFHGELSDVEMNSLYNHDKVKIHLTFTHGEGFGHPLLLSTLSGKPLLAPKWSGHLDFLNPAHTRFFEGSLQPIPDEAINEWFVKNARWFDVDQESAGKLMKYHFNNYNGAILNDAELLRIENAEKFSIKSMDTTFHAFLDKYVPVFATEEAIKLPALKRLKIPTKFSTEITADKPNLTSPITLIPTT